MPLFIDKIFVGDHQTILLKLVGSLTNLTDYILVGASLDYLILEVEICVTQQKANTPQQARPNLPYNLQ